MRVAVVTGSTSRKAGGLFTSVRRLVQEMHNMDIKVVVHSVRDDFSEADVNLWDPVVVRILMGKGPGVLGFAPGLREAVESFKPQLIQIHGLWKFVSLSVLGAARRGACPYIIHPHGMLDPWAVRNSAWKKKLAGWLFEREHLKGAACIRALSASEAESIRAFGIKNPIAIIPNGVDLPPEAGERQWSYVGSPRSEGERCFPRTLLFLGRIHPKKGIAELIDGWKLSRARLDGWILEIAGWDDGAHETGLRDRIARLDLDDSVRWAGSLFGEAKDTALRRASAFILPSLSEGLPMTVLEAWAYGLPVLKTSQCNLPEGFTAGAAIRIEPKPESIAEGLDRMSGLADGELSKMGMLGRRLVVERFRWPQVAANINSVHDWILGNRPKPECVVV
jgi:glycosyltransferase involved in cell wall biosynthesis